MTALPMSRAYELRKDEVVVARLFAMPTDATTVRVAAELYPASAHASNEPQWRFYELDTPLAAQLLEESLDAFQYLGCSVSEIEVDDQERLVRASAA